MPPILERARRFESLADLGIIDAHCHVGPWFNFHVPRRGSMESMIEVMNRVGVEVACVTACLSVGPDMKRGNDLVLEFHGLYPSRIVPYCTVNPNYPKEIPGELERTHRAGCRALKFHDIHGRRYDDAGYRTAYEFADAHELPVLVHTWGRGNGSVLAEMCRRHPRARFLFAHAGSADREEYVRWVTEIPNAYLDLVFSAMPYGSVEYFVRRTPLAKILYGSDLPFLSLTQQIGKVLMARVSDEAKRSILGLNARGLFAQALAVRETTPTAHRV